ncbi:unnamed protein product [Rotaria socialis]
MAPSEMVSANLPRSNNSIEGWHNAFAKRVSIAHPTTTKLTGKIRREQSKFEVDIAQIRQGQGPKPNHVEQNGLVYSLFIDVKRCQNGIFTAVNRPYLP